MFGFFKRFIAKKEEPCKHPGFSFSIDYNKPSNTKCHFCNKVYIEHYTDIPLFPGSNHRKSIRLWVDPDPELEQAINTSPREFGDLRVEKWMRRKGLLKS